jgi:succinate dehydrogenase / fumarate reductase, cytochrome b subunit
MSFEARLRPRPLSPHLAIYRRMMTMMMSIVHRVTGAALYSGTLLLTWWLIAAAEGPKSYRLFESWIGSPAGKFVLLCYTWALIHHLLGGLRHFAWDFGQGFDLPTANLMARATLIGSVSLTVVVWTVGIWMREALL